VTPLEQKQSSAQPLGERVELVMKLVEEKIAGARLNNNFINDVAHIYERRGYAAANLYVRGKFTDRLWDDERVAFNRLLEILKAIDENNLPPPVASFIIKKLNGVKISREVKDGRANQKSGR
jgi:hypothetical protein